ncbi:hypothetical protein K435DRAFT_796409 [Dendrothele bispora CBS 962.96]|uniref:Uncharacterized protein n=1 Tax=Dendrothele bispora (strain CBS 962.96) TaxID=1314807 RepID=A0A4S8M6Y5_DENBC|nr:hypothetical protein K435DRAFT_796409 [Dendrothele bispora CBS 962.96]
MQVLTWTEENTGHYNLISLFKLRNHAYTLTQIYRRPQLKVSTGHQAEGNLVLFEESIPSPLEGHYQREAKMVVFADGVTYIEAVTLYELATWKYLQYELTTRKYLQHEPVVTRNFPIVMSLKTGAYQGSKNSKEDDILPSLDYFKGEYFHYNKEPVPGTQGIGNCYK